MDDGLPYRIEAGGGEIAFRRFLRPAKYIKITDIANVVHINQNLIWVYRHGKQSPFVRLFMSKKSILQFEDWLEDRGIYTLDAAEFRAIPNEDDFKKKPQMTYETLTIKPLRRVFVALIFSIISLILTALGRNMLTWWEVLLFMPAIWALTAHAFWRMKVEGSEIEVRRMFLPRLKFSFDDITHVVRVNRWIARIYTKDKKRATVEFNITDKFVVFEMRLHRAGIAVIDKDEFKQIRKQQEL